MKPSASPARRAAQGGALLIALILALLWFVGDPPPAPVETAREEPVAAVPRDGPIRSPPRVPPPADPEPEPAQQPEEVAPPDILRYVVRDVFDRSAVRDVSFALAADLSAQERDAAGIVEKADEGAWLLAPDGDGTINVPKEHVRAPLTPRDPRWRVADFALPEGGAEPTIWVYRMLQVTGTVRASVTEPHLDLERVQLFARSHGANTFFGGGADDGGALTESWLTRRRLAEFGIVDRADANGRFSFEVPRVPTITVRARALPTGDRAASGWRDAAYTIPDEVIATGTAHVELTLEPGYEIRGRVVDADGNPVADADVILHVVHYVDKSELVPANLRRHGHDYTAQWDPSMPKAVVDYKVYGKTDSEGRFSVVSHIDGELTFSFIPGSDHHIENVPAGQLSGFAREDDFRLRSAKGSPVVKLVGELGRDFAGHRIGFNDLSYGDIQPTFSYTLGSDSTLPSRFLVKGHTYSFSVYPKSGALPIADAAVTWNGEDKLVIGSLRLGRKRASESDD